MVFYNQVDLQQSLTPGYITVDSLFIIVQQRLLFNYASLRTGMKRFNERTGSLCLVQATKTKICIKVIIDQLQFSISIIRTV